MHRLILGVTLLLSADQLFAQQVVPTVQLPVVQWFGVATTVSVPDRGALQSGGNDFSARTGTRFGPGIPSSGFGQVTGTASIEARVWIHDPAATDAALLTTAERQFSGLSDVAREHRARAILRQRSGLSRGSFERNFQISPDRQRAVQILKGR